MPMPSCKVLALLFCAFVQTQGVVVMKALSARSLAAAGVPDPMCKTGVISLPATGKPQSCCAGYCGECSDYPTCKKVRGQDSENACCATKVYEMRCGAGTPANVCLKKCSESVPPCILDEDKVFEMPEPYQRTAGSNCTEAVPQWQTMAEGAM